MQAKCPTCGESIVAETLNDVQRHLKRCGKVAKISAPSVKRTMLPNATSIPSLPFTIEVPRAIPSQNASHKKHWAVYSNELGCWRRTLEPLLRPVLGLNLSWSRWHFLRLIPSRGRVMDYANIVGGCKPIPDAMQEFKVIAGDDPNRFKASYSQQRLIEHLDAKRFQNEGILTVITLMEAIR